MLQKNWLLKEFDKTRVIEISKEFHISPLTSIILYNRGITDNKDIAEFLKCDLESLHDPYLLKDMEKAVSRIKTAQKNKEKITIYGDYDVDGITSIAILYKHLTSMGFEVDYYVPDRIQEGYGVNRDALDKIKESGTKVVITVDTGITAVEETEYAKSIGMDIIITDHHECKETIPEAYAAIDPKRKDCKYPFKNLAGVGVAFKLIQALDDQSSVDELMEKYSDLICLGTVADISPLVDENRIIVTKGLEKFRNTENIGLKALIDVSITNSKPITTSTIGYIIAPRINASGRLGCASRSVEMFLTSDRERAYELANGLCEENTIRQQTEQNMFAQAIEYIENNPQIKDDQVLVIPHENWHHGIVGIVSSKITEKFYKPSILFAIDGDEAKGSGRSISGFNLFEALEESSHLLEKFGGHELAAGLYIKTENIEKFREAINAHTAEKIDEKALIPTVSIDAVIKPSYITLETVDEINKLQPFGVDNPSPNFAVRNIKIHKISTMSEKKHLRMTLLKEGKFLDAVGFGMGEYYNHLKEGDFIEVAFGLDIKIHKISTMSEKKHLRMTLLKEGKFLDAVGFGMGEYYNHLKEGDFIEVAFGLDINDYKGFKNVQLILKDIKLMDVN